MNNDVILFTLVALYFVHQTPCVRNIWKIIYFFGLLWENKIFVKTQQNEELVPVIWMEQEIYLIILKCACSDRHEALF